MAPVCRHGAGDSAAVSLELATRQYVQPDDVVVTGRELPGEPGAQISGMVTNVEAVHEGRGSPRMCS